MISITARDKLLRAICYSHEPSECYAYRQAVTKDQLGLSGLFIDDVGLLRFPMPLQEHILKKHNCLIESSPCIIPSKNCHLVVREDFTGQVNKIRDQAIESMFNVSLEALHVGVEANLDSLVVCRPGESYQGNYNFNKPPGMFGIMFLSLPVENGGSGTAIYFKDRENSSIVFPEDVAMCSVLAIAASRNIRGKPIYQMTPHSSTIAFLKFNLVWTDVFPTGEPPRPVSFPRFITSVHEAQKAVDQWLDEQQDTVSGQDFEQPASNAGSSLQIFLANPHLKNKYAVRVLRAIKSLNMGTTVSRELYLQSRRIKTKEDLRHITKFVTLNFAKALTQSSRGNSNMRNAIREDIKRLLQLSLDGGHTFLPEECLSALNVSSLITICLSLGLVDELALVFKFIDAEKCLCGGHDWIAKYHQSSESGSMATDVVDFMTSFSGWDIILPVIFEMLENSKISHMFIDFAREFIDSGNQEAGLQVVDLILEKLTDGEIPANLVADVMKLFCDIETVTDSILNRCIRLLQYLLNLPIPSLKRIMLEYSRINEKTVDGMFQKLADHLIRVFLEADLKSIREVDFFLLCQTISKYGNESTIDHLWNIMLDELQAANATLYAKKPLIHTPFLIRAISGSKSTQDRSEICSAMSASTLTQEIFNGLIEAFVSISLCCHANAYLHREGLTALFLFIGHVGDIDESTAPKIDALCSGFGRVDIYDLWNLIVGIDIRFPFDCYPVTKKMYECVLAEIIKRDIFEVVQSSAEEFVEVFKRYCVYKDSVHLKGLVEQVATARHAIDPKFESIRTFLHLITSMMSVEEMYRDVNSARLSKDIRRSLDILFESWLKLALIVVRIDRSAHGVSIRAFYRSFIKAEKYYGCSSNNVLRMFNDLSKEIDWKILIDLILNVQLEPALKKQVNFMSSFTKLCSLMLSNSNLFASISSCDVFSFVKCVFWLGKSELLRRACDQVCCSAGAHLFNLIVKSKEIRQRAKESATSSQCLQAIVSSYAKLVSDNFELKVQGTEDLEVKLELTFTDSEDDTGPPELEELKPIVLDSSSHQLSSDSVAKRLKLID